MSQMETYKATSLTSVDAGGEESRVSAVSWAAILAGAATVTSTGLILLALGAGVGLASVSPWGGSPSVTTFTAAAAVWLIVIEWFSSALGGYVTGRLRTKWVGLHTEEVTFRDTAHGLLAWAVAVIIAAAALGSASNFIVGGGGSSGNANVQAASTEAYYVDLLFRGENGNGAPQAHEQATSILSEAARSGTVPTDDRNYLGQLVAAQTRLSQADADKRVSDVLNRAKSALDAARKAAAAASIFTAFSLLIGAFIASAAAAIGGRQRDA